MGAISELYRGEISAPTDIRVRADRYNDLNDRAEDMRTQLTAKLAEEAVNTIDELIDIHRQMESITSEDSYTRGFRDGARLMLDMLNG